MIKDKGFRRDSYSSKKLSYQICVSHILDFLFHIHVGFINQLFSHLFAYIFLLACQATLFFY